MLKRKDVHATVPHGFVLLLFFFFYLKKTLDNLWKFAKGWESFFEMARKKESPADTIAPLSRRIPVSRSFEFN